MNLLAQIQTESVDYSALKVLLPLSGDINSAALLCWLAEEIPADKHPLELHLYYSHFTEHSPDTFKFVADLIRYARKRFKSVFVRITRNSVNKYFRANKMIPHPSISPCSSRLKYYPSEKYFKENDLDIDLIGFVKTDIKRFKNMTRRSQTAQFPILEWSKQDCLDYVKKIIGWYPAIYDLKDENGKDLFSHNNCLPCKNMHPKQLALVAKYFPKHAAIAEETARLIPGAYWGREDVPDIFKCDVCERMS
jgi:3'-phosphoadenosine 5'-phosphosulfate sulfotransferase (PAPS reductase)/FAD synthetase